MFKPKFTTLSFEILPSSFPPSSPVQWHVPQAPAGPVHPAGGALHRPYGVIHRPVHPPWLRAGNLAVRQVSALLLSNLPLHGSRHPDLKLLDKCKKYGNTLLLESKAANQNVDTENAPCCHLLHYVWLFKALCLRDGLLHLELFLAGSSMRTIEEHFMVLGNTLFSMSVG